MNRKQLLDEEKVLPESPIEMASWVRERAIRTVRQLSEVISILRAEGEQGAETRSDIHFALSGALANSLKLLSFASGHHLSPDELSQMVGVIYQHGVSGFEEVALRLECQDEAVTNP